MLCGYRNRVLKNLMKYAYTFLLFYQTVYVLPYCKRQKIIEIARKLIEQSRNYTILFFQTFQSMHLKLPDDRQG